MPENSTPKIEDFKELTPFQPYLTLLATLHIQQNSLGKPLLTKLDPEDLVQETLLRAWRFRDQFHGLSQSERLGWLRQILSNVMVSHLRAYLTEKRNIRLEIAVNLDKTSRNLEEIFGFQNDLTPCSHATREEEVTFLANAILKLKPIGRSVILARHMEGLTFRQIASRIGKSPEAVAKIWSRNLRRLRRSLGGFE